MRRLQNGENGEEGITAYMYLVPVLNDDDGRLGMLSKMPWSGKTKGIQGR